MKRLSLSAFAITLAFLMCVLGVCAHTSLQHTNAAIENEIQSICRLSAQWLDSAAFPSEDTRSLLVDSAFNTGTVIHLLTDEGDIVYASRLQSDPPTQEEISATVADGLYVSQRMHATYRATWVYAYALLGDGNILRVSRSAETVSSLWGVGTLLFPLLALGMAIGVYCIVEFSQHRVRLPMRRMTGVLEDFIEGDFDSRIPQDMAISAEDTAHFNRVMGRLQDRVFRQSARNNALSAVMNSMKNGMLAVDNEMHILIITPEAKKLLNISGSPENQTLSRAVHDVDLVPMFKEAMEQPGVYTNSAAVRTGMGRAKRPLRLYVSPMSDSGRVQGAVAIIEDVTELRRLQEVRNDFAANVSHELKTPLTSIKGFVETLQAGAINNPEMAQRFLKIINLEADRLTRLINDILSISKLESGDENLPKERIDMNRVAADVCEMLRLLASQKKVTIHLAVGNTPCYIYGNPDRIRQMVINLVENAIKYNQESGRVDVSVQPSDQVVNFLCEDTGIGIAEEHFDRLFERFYRVDKGRSRNMGGTGLGLAIVKHIVLGHGGMIEVHSKLKEGTQFHVQLPRMPEDAQDSPVEDNPFSAEDTPGTYI